MKMRLAQGERLCTLFISLRKAFDTVEHKMLIEKISDHGIYPICNGFSQI